MLFLHISQIISFSLISWFSINSFIEHSFLCLLIQPFNLIKPSSLTLKNVNFWHSGQIIFPVSFFVLFFFFLITVIVIFLFFFNSFNFSLFSKIFIPLYKNNKSSSNNFSVLFYSFGDCIFICFCYIQNILPIHKFYCCHFLNKRYFK